MGSSQAKIPAPAGTPMHDSAQSPDMPVKVDRVYIDGVAQTKDDILAKAVEELLECTDFREMLSACTDVRRQLESLGAFKRIAVDIDTSKGSDASPNGYEVTFRVKETRRVVGGVNTLVGNNEGSMVVGAKLPNLAGRGEFVQLEYQYGTKHSSSFSLTASKPFLGRHRPRVTAAVYQQAADFPWNAFRECNRGLLTELGFESLRGVHHALRWEAVWRELHPLGAAVPFAVREQMGHTLKSSLKHIVTIDTRNNSILPSEGCYVRFCQELAGGQALGGDIQFVKHELEHQANYSLDSRGDFVFQIASTVGHMTSPELNSSSKRSSLGNHIICDKFFIGGPLGLRGFHLRGVGPQSEGSSLGGTTFWSSGVHLYTPLPFRQRSVKRDSLVDQYIRLHGFVTAGAISEGYDADKLQDARVSAGGGLVFSLGHMARLELNYVVPLRHSVNDRTSGGLQIGVGVSFL